MRMKIFIAFFSLFLATSAYGHSIKDVESQLKDLHAQESRYVDLLKAKSFEKGVKESLEANLKMIQEEIVQTKKLLSDVKNGKH